MGFTLNRLSTDFAGEISQGLDVPQDARGDPNRYPTARREAVVAAQPARFRHPCSLTRFLGAMAAVLLA